MSKLIVNTSIPVGAISHSVSSASKHIIKSKLQRFYPESQTEYTPEGNNELVFHIASPAEMWDPTSSYIRFKLNTALNFNGANDLTKYLAEGGAHALFQKVEIFTRAGVLIERVDEYNKLYSLMSSASMSRDFVEYSKQDEADSGEPYSPFITVNYTTASYDDAGGAVDRLFENLAGSALSEIAVGDKVQIITTIGVFERIVESVPNDNSFQVTVALGADVAAGNISSIQFADKPKTVRELYANTANVEVMMCPWSSFLNNGSYIPLQLIRGGLRVVFTLARAPYVMSTRNISLQGGADFSGANYTISTPEWMCQMYQPDESLNAQMLDMYKNQGLHYMFPIYRHFLDVVGGGASTENLNHHVNLRSVRSVYQKIQDQRANIITSNVDGGASTYTADSIAQGLKAGLGTYQYSVGSLRFPESSPTKLTSISNAEALKELKRTMGQMGANNVFDKRFEPCEWRSSRCSKYPNESGNRAESQRLILSANMARDPTPFSGVDASLANLQSELKFDSPYDFTKSDGVSALDTPINNPQRYVHTWVEADAILSLGSEATVRRS